MKPIRPSRRRGVSLAATLVIVILIAGLSAGFLILALNENRYSDVVREKVKATYLAEAGNEQAALFIRSTLANYGIIAGPTPGNIVIGSTPVSYEITPVGASFQTTDPTGLQINHQRYRVVSSCDYLAAERGVEKASKGRIVRSVEAQQIPIFQFMAFYNSDLEYLPGPSSTVNGRIHTNYDLYLAVGNGNTLSLNGRVSAVGQMYRRRKDNGSQTTGTVRVRDAQPPNNYVNWSNGLESTDPNWVSQATSNWHSNVANGDMGASVMEPPTMNSIQAGGFYHTQAQSNGLVIERTAGGALAATYQGIDVTAQLQAQGVLTTNTIYDAREGTTVPTVEINLAALMTTSPNRHPPNGVIYALNTGASAANPKGFVVKNGAELQAPLTVVSPDLVYVQGDYNTVSKKPAAVIADSVNLLSNAWNNTKTGTSGLPNASSTTYNFAMITGKVSTQGSQYSGGLENLPRFHENWSGMACTYRGSMVNLWDSVMGDGLWVYGGNRYTAPTRNWDFDQDFNTVGNLPPLTPMVVMIARVAYDSW